MILKHNTTTTNDYSTVEGSKDPATTTMVLILKPRVHRPSVDLSLTFPPVLTSPQVLTPDLVRLSGELLLWILRVAVQHGADHGWVRAFSSGGLSIGVGGRALLLLATVAADAGVHTRQRTHAALVARAESGHLQLQLVVTGHVHERAPAERSLEARPEPGTQTETHSSMGCHKIKSNARRLTKYKTLNSLVSRYCITDVDMVN